MKVKEMHLMRLKKKEAIQSIKRYKGKKSLTPLAKEIEKQKDDMIRGILDNTPNLVNQQFKVANLDVEEGGKDNDTVMKATNALLDRVFGKPKETVDLNGSVEFSLKALAQERLKVANEDVTPLEDMI